MTSPVNAQRTRRSTSPAVIRRARRLAERVQAIVRRYPQVDPDNVRLTLIALELTPEERLQRSLRRGRGFAAFRS